MSNRLFERYLQRNPVIHSLSFPEGLGLIVIIPVLDDSEIFDTLESLCVCTIPERPVGVVVLVNHSVQSDTGVIGRNLQLAEQLKSVISRKKIPGLYFRLLEMYDMPVKYAGVGLARKTAMDAAIKYFYDSNNTTGVLVSLDADTRTDINYFTEIFRLFSQSPIAAVSINYAHRLDDLECHPAQREAIICYELYLRYYRQAIYYTGHPYYYHCIGSAFAVRAVDYAAQGGMNKKQAGEDFYFLQKMMSTGRYAELLSTTVYPSARISSRTPFGTGQSVGRIIEDGGILLTYDFQAFRELKYFFQTVNKLFKASEAVVTDYFQTLPPSLRDFLTLSGFVKNIEEINGNCASEKQFKKRFFDCYNAFQILKYLNHSHDHYFAKRPVEVVAQEILAEYTTEISESPEELLVRLRDLSKISDANVG